MNKDDKPKVQLLARGPLLPKELLTILERAAVDATYTSIRVAWKDKHSARIRDIAELDPIEDIENVSRVYAVFSYEDGSDLTVEVDDYLDSQVSALGQEARKRQSALYEYWGTLPNRSRLNDRRIGLLLKISIGLLFSSAAVCIYTLINHELRESVPFYTAVMAYTVIAWSGFFFIRSRPGVRAVGKLVVLNRPETRTVDKWAIVSGLTSIAALAVAIITYLWPRN